ncbi:hypothetical protein M9H77_23836 [Catharanthus roseus]|uniref:Uncharacterized protein n=1 Tax=Catharanthus roseus TaxID=4058 RepID=A0ACC0AU50_CATRO|nr:hypothetical protein M9H77_23836 [Catharanthus roseus]
MTFSFSRSNSDSRPQPTDGRLFVIEKEEQFIPTNWECFWYGYFIFVLLPMEPVLNCLSNWLFQKIGRDTIHILTSTSQSGGLKGLLSKYIDSANAKVKRMEVVLRSQTASFQNMENHIKLIAKRIIEEPLSHIPSNMIILRDVEEQVMTFPMIMDDDDETAQEPEELTFSKKEEGQQEIMEMRQDDHPSFEEPP